MSELPCFEFEIGSQGCKKLDSYVVSSFGQLRHIANTQLPDTQDDEEMGS